MGRRIWYQWGSGFPGGVYPIGGFTLTMIVKEGAAQRALWRGDVAEDVRQWARWCALYAARLFDCPEVVKEYLRTNDPSLQGRARALLSRVPNNREEPRLARNRAEAVVATATLSLGSPGHCNECAGVSAREAARVSAYKACGTYNSAEPRRIKILGHMTRNLERVLLHAALPFEHGDLLRGGHDEEAREVAIDVLLSRSQPATQLAHAPVRNNVSL